MKINHFGGVALVAFLGASGLTGCDDGAQGDAPADAAQAPDQRIPDGAPLDAAPLDARPLDAGPPADAAPDAQPWPHGPRPRPVAAKDVPAPRGLTWARGLIHMHSVHSHDACDGEPKPDGVPDQTCLARFRAAACHNRFDFILLTDHPGTFEEIAFEDAFLHQPGDRWIDGPGGHVANLIACPEDGAEVLLMPGSEGDLMPVMLTEKPPPGALRDATPEGVRTLKQAGALVFQAHTERFTAAQLAPLGLDGIEIYNLHANLAPDGALRQLPEVLPDLLAWINAGAHGPHPDLAYLAIFRENHLALAAWDGLIADTQILGFAGSDIHENLPAIVQPGDGDRLDSYRRLGGFFSNWALVDAMTPLGLRNALRAGRVLVVFDLWGPPRGFDFVAEAGETRWEMGIETLFTDDTRLKATPPEVAGGGTPRMVLKRVWAEGVEVLHDGPGPIDVAAPGPGAYRVEVHVVPEQIRAELGSFAERFLREVVWIYSNPIYLRGG